MTNFLFYFGEYQKNKCQNAGVELTPNRLTVKVPDCTKNNDTAAAFFAGDNVVTEEITTNNGYRYKATVHANGCSDMESFKKLLCQGLSELGYNYRECKLQEVPNKKGKNYEVTITMQCKGSGEKLELFVYINIKENPSYTGGWL